eukprot:gene8214-1478_t
MAPRCCTRSVQASTLALALATIALLLMSAFPVSTHEQLNTTSPTAGLGPDLTCLKHEWSVELYGDLLEIGGGMERMTKYFKATTPVFAFSLNVQHSANSADEAVQAGVTVAVCSTSNQMSEQVGHAQRPSGQALPPWVPNLEIELDQPEASSSSSQGLANAGAQAHAPDELRHLEIELEQPATAGSQDSQGLATAEWEHLWNR